MCGCPVTGVRLPAVPRLGRRPHLCGPGLIFAAGIGASEDFLSGLGHRRARFRLPAQRDRAHPGDRMIIRRSWTDSGPGRTLRAKVIHISTAPLVHTCTEG